MILSAPKVEIRMVPLRDIKVDQSFNPRVGGTNKDTAAEYAADMQRGDEFPPAVVYEDKQRVLWLSEGFTRYEACGIAEVPSMRCEIRQGDRRAAALNATSRRANGTHGIRFTTADKRNAIRILFTVLGAGEWSDRRIADHVGVSPTTVGDERAAVSKLDTIEMPTMRVGKDGVAQPATKGESSSPPREKLPAVAPPPDDDEIPPPDPKVDFEADVEVVCLRLAECRLGLEECRAEIERLAFTAFGSTIGHKRALALLDAIDLLSVAAAVWSPRKGKPPTG